MCIYVYVYKSIEGKIAIDRYISIYKEISTSISTAPPGGSQAVADPTDPRIEVSDMSAGYIRVCRNIYK